MDSSVNTPECKTPTKTQSTTTIPPSPKSTTTTPHLHQNLHHHPLQAKEEKRHMKSLSPAKKQYENKTRKSSMLDLFFYHT